jgi:hypothetical protein
MTFQEPAYGRRALAEHVWVALALVACSLALFLAVDYGNSYGRDDGVHTYLAWHAYTPDGYSRPLAISVLRAFYLLFHTDLIAYHFVLIGLRAASAFLTYHLVRLLTPARPVFAFVAGLLTAIFVIADRTFVMSFVEYVGLGGQVVALLALDAFVAYLVGQRLAKRSRVALLLASLVLVGGVVLMREDTVPLLVAVPSLVVVLKRAWSRPNLLGMAAWLGITFAATSLYALPLLGLAPATYSSANFLDLDLGRMLSASLSQVRYAFQPLAFLDSADLFEYLLPALLVALVAVTAFRLVRWKLRRPGEAGGASDQAALVHFAVWLGVGLAATWLGFAAFLPTGSAASRIRVQLLSAPGEAITLASGIWLLGRLAREGRGRRLVQLGGISLVAIYGAVNSVASQSGVYGYAAGWENRAYFLRSLAHLAPQVTPPSLFVYVENPALDETPFVNGFTFQYAVRYFYDDQATGLIPTDNIFDRWSAGDAGITMEERWIAEPRVYGWDEMIFVTRDEAARLLILDILPDDFYTESRQALYRPHLRIQAAFVSERVRESFPVVAGPDWSGRKQFLAGQP